MNPLLVTGLIAVGQKLVDNIFTKPPQSTLPTNAAAGSQFEDHLNAQSVQPPSELMTFLNSKGIRSGSDLQNLQFQLRQQLFNHPEFASFMASADRTAGFQLTLEASGLYTLSDSRGRQITFSEQTSQGQLAKRIAQLQHMDISANAFPGYSMQDLTSKAGILPAGEMRLHLPGLH